MLARSRVCCERCFIEQSSVLTSDRPQYAAPLYRWAGNSVLSKYVITVTQSYNEQSAVLAMCTRDHLKTKYHTRNVNKEHSFIQYLKVNGQFSLSFLADVIWMVVFWFLLICTGVQVCAVRTSVEPHSVCPALSIISESSVPWHHSSVKRENR